MITFMVLLFIALSLIVSVVTISLFGVVAFLTIFGDLLVFILIIVVLVKVFEKLKTNRKTRKK